MDIFNWRIKKFAFGVSKSVDIKRAQIVAALTEADLVGFKGKRNAFNLNRSKPKVGTEASQIPTRKIAPLEYDTSASLSTIACQEEKPSHHEGQIKHQLVKSPYRHNY